MWSYVYSQRLLLKAASIQEKALASVGGSVIISSVTLDKLLNVSEPLFLSVKLVR